MTEKVQRTIHIKWVRSGIGFTYRQKEMVRSLGLRRMNQVVARPDTAQIRGLVARIPHLVEIVNEPAKPAPWELITEYTLKAAEAVLPESPAPEKVEVKEGAAAQAEAVPEEMEEVSEATEKMKAKAPARARKAAKSEKSVEAKGKAGKQDGKKKTKAAATKDAKPVKSKKK